MSQNSMADLWNPTYGCKFFLTLFIARNVTADIRNPTTKGFPGFIILRDLAANIRNDTASSFPGIIFYVISRLICGILRLQDSRISFKSRNFTGGIRNPTAAGFPILYYSTEYHG